MGNKSKTLFWWFALSIPLILFEWQLENSAMAAKNELIFERFVCEQNAKNKIFSYFKCEIKQVSRGYLRMHVEGNLSRPLRGILAHGIVYYKYNTYQKWAVDMWEDICGWLSGTKHSYFMDLTVKKVINYSNFNHPCPLEGSLLLKVNNISMEKFPFEHLVPSGRYRLDVHLTEENKESEIALLKLYIAVSDHRIEQY